MLRFPFKLSLLAALALSACSGNPSLPKRQIDRPFTLPEDTHAFSVGAGYSHLRSDDHPSVGDRVYPIGIWRIPISETWTWELLSAVSHQFHHDEANTTGILFGAREISYSTLDGFVIEPLLELYYRHNFSPNFALGNMLGGTYAYYDEKPEFRGWRIFYKASPTFQLDDTKAISPEVQVSMTKRYAAPLQNWQKLLPENTTRITFPLGLDFQWRLSQGWEFQFDYEFLGLGYRDGFRAHFTGLSFIHYW